MHCPDTRERLPQLAANLSAKVVEFMRQIAPKSTQIAGLRNPLNPSSVLQLAELEAAAKAFKMPLQMFHATAAAELDGAFAQIGTLRNAGVVVLTDPMFVTERKRIADLALQYRLPAFCVLIHDKRRLIEVSEIEHRSKAYW